MHQLHARAVIAGLLIASCARSPNTVSPVFPEPPCAHFDFSADKDNCGACGHSCLGGACNSGHCQPFEIAKETGVVQGVFANDKFVAWRLMEEGGSRWTVRARSWESANSTTLASGDDVGRPMAVAGEHLYWCNDSHIARVARKGGAIERFFETKERCASLKSNGEQLLFVSDRSVYLQPPGDGPLRRLTMIQPDFPGRAAFQGDSVVIYGAASYALRLLPNGKLAPLKYMTEMTVNSFFSSGDEVYSVESYSEPGPFDEENGGYGHSIDAIVHTGFGRDAPRVRLVTKQMSAGIRDVYDGYLYWSDGGIFTNPVDIRRLRLPNGKAEDLVTIPWAGGGIAFTRHRIVWDEGEGHGLHVLAK